jgi:hypothetical protein
MSMRLRRRAWRGDLEGAAQGHGLAGAGYVDAPNASDADRARIRALLRTVYGAVEEARVVALPDAGQVPGPVYERLARGDTLDADGKWIFFVGTAPGEIDALLRARGAAPR